MRKPAFLFLALFLALFQTAMGETYTLSSPGGRLTLTATLGEGPLLLRLAFDGEVLPADITASMKTATMAPGFGAKVKKKQTARIHETISTVLYRQAHVANEANELTLTFREGYGLVLRVYDHGYAYRFFTTLKDQTIDDEQFDWQLPSGAKAYLAYSTNDKNPFAMAFQNWYKASSFAQAEKNLAFLPLTVDLGKAKLTLLEADVEAYPGMFVKTTPEGKVSGVFARYPKQTDYHAWRHQQYVVATEDYIARTTAPRAFPWRAVALTTDDRQMPVNDLCYLLSSPSRVAETDWIEGGLVAWDWWSDWNLRGVDFKAGINTATYRHYIDFAARHHLSYIVLDEGWFNSRTNDMLTVVPEVDLPALVAYGREKGVGIILWTIYNVLDSQLEAICRHYAEMGIAGFKVDFLDRNDQTAAEMTYRIAEACARHHLTLDLHGFYPPMGIQRTWPNVVNVEAVFGMEEMKWSPDTVDMPAYDVAFPFIRQMAGSTDYTPGAMTNGTKKNWRARYDSPMSQGTRCHQLASYIIVDSPLTMLADTPSAYEDEPEVADFLSLMPTRPDTTLILEGKLGETITTARRQGARWYVAAQTNWTPRQSHIALDFLPEGRTYKATIYRDGINAGHNAEDYVRETLTVSHQTRLTLDMASGGGYAMVIE